MLSYQHDRWVLDLPEFGQPLFVEFKKLDFTQKKPLIARAVGIKKNRVLPQICDLSAGLGKDAYVLYQLGCQVKLVERSPIIAKLLEDGLKRAGCTMSLTIGEAKDYLNDLLKNNFNNKLNNFPDVIYFDPIFPDQNKTALSQKSARILRQIAGQDNDAAEVFQLALRAAKKRVVIKRGLHSPFINDQKPDIIFKGKTIRFDVYFMYNQPA